MVSEISGDCKTGDTGPYNMPLFLIRSHSDSLSIHLFVYFEKKKNFPDMKRVTPDANHYKPSTFSRG